MDAGVPIGEIGPCCHLLPGFLEYPPHQAKQCSCSAALVQQFAGGAPHPHGRSDHILMGAEVAEVAVEVSSISKLLANVRLQTSI